MSLGPHPRLDRLAGAVEGHVLAGTITGGRERQRMQMAGGQHVGQTLHGDETLHQLGKRCVVEQGPGLGVSPARQYPAQRQHGEPLGSATYHSERVCPVYLLSMKIAPHLAQQADRIIESVSTAS